MSSKQKKVVICDFDGVLTSTEETPGSYINHKGTSYGMSPKCFERLCRLCAKTGSVVIIASNWRRFDDVGRWSYCTFDGIHMFKNPLPTVKSALGRLYAGDLPKDRHITKAQALVLWLKQTGYDGKFVIFDDDLCEGYQTTCEYGIAQRFIKTDQAMGLTDEDVLKAERILS